MKPAHKKRIMSHLEKAKKHHDHVHELMSKLNEEKMEKKSKSKGKKSKKDCY